MKYFASIFMLLWSVASFAQSQMTEEQEKQLYDNIQKEVEKYENILELADWQTFYVDSILVHNYTAIMDEIMALNKAKVSNTDAFQRVQDKYNEATYVAFEKLLTPEQWEKYLKSGAARDKKGRDKREAKRSN